MVENLATDDEIEFLIMKVEQPEKETSLFVAPCPDEEKWISFIVDQKFKGHKRQWNFAQFTLDKEESKLLVDEIINYWGF